MSSFNALNLSAQDEELEAEEHSRELQIEECFELYQNALIQVKENNFSEARLTFESLFNINVLKPNRWGLYSYSSPTLDSLRYLAFRNRGMFFYKYLIHNYSDLSDEDIVNYILKVMEDLIEAMQHSEADSGVTSLLVQIFKSFKSKKLERLILEYELSKSNNIIPLSGRRRGGILPQLKVSIRQYASLLKKLNDNEAKSYQLLNIKKLITEQDFDDITELNPLLKTIQKMKTEDEQTMKELDAFEVTISKLSWESVFDSLKELLPHVKTSILLTRNVDPYNEVEDPIETVEFKFKIKETLKEEKINNQIPTDIDQADSKTNNSVTIHKIQTAEHGGTIEIDNMEYENQGSNSPPISSRKRSVSEISERTSYRVSKRSKGKDSDIIIDSSMDIHEAFFDGLEFLFSVTNKTLPFTLHTLGSQLALKDEVESKFLPYADFMECLRNWSSWHTELFNKNETNFQMSTKNTEDMSQLNNVLKSNIFGNQLNEMMNNCNSDIPSDDIISMLDEMNSKKYHFQEIRLRLLVKLLHNKDISERIIIKYNWPDNLFTKVEWFLLGCESSIFDFISENFTTYQNFALSVLEFLINMLGRINENIHSKKAQGSKTTDNKYQKNKVETKIDRWLLLLKQVEEKDYPEYVLCVKWLYYCYLQYTSDNIDEKLIYALREVDNLFSKAKPGFTLMFGNYHFLPCLKLGTIHSQLGKINIIQKITNVEHTNNKQSDTDHDFYLTILENALSVMCNNTKEKNKMNIEIVQSPITSQLESMNEDKDMYEFIQNAPYLLKIKLWEILYSSYSKKGNFKKVFKCYLNILSLVIENIFSDDYSKEPSSTRNEILLYCMGIIGSYSSKVVKFIRLLDWKFEDMSLDDSDFYNIFSAFSLFYILLFFEANVANDPSTTSFFKKAVKSSAKMKARICDMTIILTLVFDQTFEKLAGISDMLTVKFITNFHTFLGAYKFCDASGGHFLSFSENFLSNYINKEAFIQLNQITWCKYHFNVIGDSPLIEQHNTKEVEMEVSNAIPLGLYLTKYYSAGKNLLLTTSNKTGLKHILEKVIDTIDTSINSFDFVMEKNAFELAKYLSQNITDNMITDSFEGKSRLSLLSPNDDFKTVLDTGLFYFGSIQALNFYKMRKKSMQARPSELDSIIKSLKTDILYNTGRFESWYLLGKCHSFIVEDDLIWTSEKITSIEKKVFTASSQRKAIICYLTGISLFLSKGMASIEDKLVYSKLLASLGKELVSGYLKPMDKECFIIRNNVSKLPEDKDTEEENKYNSPLELTIASTFVEKLILRVFRDAIDISDKLEADVKIVNNQVWSWHYILGKRLLKFSNYQQKFPGLDYIVKACKIAYNQSSSREPIIEPHYCLVNNCYKLLKRKVICVSELLKYLHMDNEFFDKDDGFWFVDEALTYDYQIKDCYSKIMELLHHILSVDKKKWQHRPKYRISRILYEEFHDVTGAIKQLDSLISIKSTNKNLVNIWKPDFERAGKHFIYTQQYIMFYSNLLYQKGDYNSLGLIAKKVRRFSSGMAYANETTTTLVNLYKSCIKQQLHFDDKQYTDQLMSTLSYQGFVKTSTDLQNTFDKTKYPQEILDSLSVVYQLKKGHNGIIFDGICLSLYFKYFYLPHAETLSSVSDDGSTHSDTSITSQNPLTVQDSNSLFKTSSSVKKKVTKRETFDKIKTLTEKF
ncbi:hypothetical protein TBLA_0E04910 [Henningerozyma blattae CBS 6284]|uniref:Histone transcription regulator 3 homolog n=1 Tax=Henningerozyma blattae (strain ATCC 34711 / CBS 6284 / DSM 70876 / NBRC 10599 / NRRL Y-10934 / UCD 77-7) TaxID=1071380 RepID=I2H588_HENB6|nr:hypothetical protein TBLA_0E04910 [Tetrapisispora blattae CBS 6284]CCH61540.1 hypothetical protein TBLA_0E04910 [Tetrapisispora blattae CBS 6284]